VYIVAESRLSQLPGSKSFKVIEKFPGSKLKGLR
jgi:hypothetical protein